MIITRPDDWHLHVRDGAVLKSVVPHSAQQFTRAMIMPNLATPITTVAAALLYRQRILQAVPNGNDFYPYMTLYLTDNTHPDEIRRMAETPEVMACKLYPAGATTHSNSGVTQPEKIYPVLEVMQQLNVPLLIHGEVTDSDIDIFDREKIFIERHLSAITRHFPALRIVFEHVTTRDAVQFVEAANTAIAATITPQHLLYNRNQLLVGGIRPHAYCLPVLKREVHRLALVQAAISGNPRFFLGTDSAPHSQGRKECAVGCAGCYSALNAMELYAEVFDAEDALDKLEAFASYFGADFYALQRNTATLTLQRSTWEVPHSLPFDEEKIVPLKAGEIVNWQCHE